jgi:DNA-binding SARP family transcriptional activator
MQRPTRTAPGPRETTAIQAKLRVPSLPERFVARPRLVRSLTAVLEVHRVVVVCATAGAGKSTAVAETARALDRPVAWLTVDRTDTAPGRLVTYLEAAVAKPLPELSGVAVRALSAGIPHGEAAGLLAEAVADAPLVFVLDELERLGESGDAWAVIEAFLRYAPPAMRVLLLSRREIPPTLCELPVGAGVAAFGEADLAFTPAEAADALANLGKRDIDAGAAVEATGGWVTGILFEAWRSADHIAGVGGEADPLHGYLASHILDQLDPTDRDFLVATSLLDEVSPARAAALGLTHAGERLARLRALHLPVVWRADGRVMRCHSRFREYLLARLERRDTDELNALRAAHGRLLVQEGHHEEATEEFLSAGALGEARTAAEHAIVEVTERLDFGIAGRWLGALAAEAPLGASPLTSAEVMLGAARDDFRRGARIGDELAARGELERLVRSSERAAALVAWCYTVCARVDDAHAVMALARQGPEVGAVRYSTRLFADPPGEGEAVAPGLTGGPLDAVVLISHYLLGRLSELDAVRGSRWTVSVTAPWRIAALRATGHTREALELYETAVGTGMNALGLDTIVGPELLLEAGRHEQARQALARGLRASRESGARLYELLTEILGAKLALRSGRDTVAARASLDKVERQPEVPHLQHFREFVDVWYGLALLLESEPGPALVRLRRATKSMLAGGRILELPTAAVYLAEAEWRAGDEDAADRAADLALDAARRQGSNHILLQALADFPAVVSRRIDAEPGADSPWHELGRALIAQGVAIDARAGVSVSLREFGSPAIVVDGKAVRPRIAKSYELLAYLGSRRGAQADREELLHALFDARADESTRAYLRQAIHQLRQLLPTQGGLVVDHGRVRLGDNIGLTTDSTRFETQLAEAARLQGEERLVATLAAIAIFDQGEYLPLVRSAWADERRRQLADRAVDARYAAANLAFAAGRYRQAQDLGEEVLRADPYREAAWRLMMRVANALGDDDGVIACFQGCERALARLEMTPAPATRQLLERLRR